jgi:hypothetical protein
VSTVIVFHFSLLVSVGVPQGSVSDGPLLFWIYSNDIRSLPLRGSVRLFADDTAVFYPCVEVTELVGSVRADLTRLKHYFTANKLTLNADKTYYLVFKTLNKKLPDMAPIFYGTSPIKRVNTLDYIWTSNWISSGILKNYSEKFRLWLGCCTN